MMFPAKKNLHLVRALRFWISKNAMLRDPKD